MNACALENHPAIRSGGSIFVSPSPLLKTTIDSSIKFDPPENQVIYRFYRGYPRLQIHKTMKIGATLPFKSSRGTG